MVSLSFNRPKDEEFAHYTDTSQSDFKAGITCILFFIKDKTWVDVYARYMEKCLWSISVVAKRHWGGEHRGALSVRYSDLVLGLMDATVVLCRPHICFHPPWLDTTPVRLPQNVSILENHASVPRSDPVAPVSGPRLIRRPRFKLIFPQ